MNFEPINFIERARDNLAELRQHRSVAEYINRLRELVLEIPDIPAAELMDKFKRGLKPKIRTEVELRGATTLDEMIRVAERFDTINFTAYQRFQGRTGQHTTAGPTYRTNGPSPMELAPVQQPTPPGSPEVINTPPPSPPHPTQQPRRPIIRPAYEVINPSAPTPPSPPPPYHLLVIFTAPEF
ncbi:unnamed protein product [Closterium sp. NIES-64]|nr:unnamed protein product [Closterium sp. NIES-64]CAI6010858.1 unnamed protein product [Closterium sp. NIES-65]